MQDLAGIGKLVGSKVAENVYEDAASGAFKEVGKIGADLAKTARLFLAPIQVAASFQNRFEKYLRTLEERVPKECRVEVHPQISGPALESMRYIEESDALWGMFCELLSKAADSRNVQYAHPSFVHILRQLTRDEVYLLARLREGSFSRDYTMDYDNAENKFVNTKIVGTSIPYDELHSSASFDIYYSHLESLSLVAWPVMRQEPIFDEHGVQTGLDCSSTIVLTKFGVLFVDACTEKKE